MLYPTHIQLRKQTQNQITHWKVYFQDGTTRIISKNHRNSAASAAMLCEATSNSPITAVSGLTQHAETMALLVDFQILIQDDVWREECRTLIIQNKDCQSKEMYMRHFWLDEDSADDPDDCTGKLWSGFVEIGDVDWALDTDEKIENTLPSIEGRTKKQILQSAKDGNIEDAAFIIEAVSSHYGAANVLGESIDFSMEEWKDVFVSLHI